MFLCAFYYFLQILVFDYSPIIHILFTNHFLFRRSSDLFLRVQSCRRTPCGNGDGKKGLPVCTQKPNEHGTGILLPPPTLSPSLNHVSEKNNYPLCTLPQGPNSLSRLYTFYQHVIPISNDLSGFYRYQQGFLKAALKEKGNTGIP